MATNMAIGNGDILYIHIYISHPCTVDLSDVLMLAHIRTITKNKAIEATYDDTIPYRQLPGGGGPSCSGHLSVWTALSALSLSLSLSVDYY